MFGPDLDLFSHQYKRWKKLRYIWLPYQKVIPHRSKWSHGPFIGTIVRLIYLGLWLVIFALLAIAVWGGVKVLVYQINWLDFVHIKAKQGIVLMSALLKNNIAETVAILLGLELGSASHYIADWLSTTWKKLRKKKR